MKPLILLALLLAAAPARAAYFDNAFKNPGQAPAGALLLFTSKGATDGGVGTFSPIYHRANPDESLLPKSWQAYIPPETWGLDLGFGGNGQTGFLYAAIDWNVAPQLLFPLTKALAHQGGNYAAFGQIVTQTGANGASTGQGVRLDVGWKLSLVSDGAVPKFDQLRAPPRYGAGYSWIFGGAK
jgi:hypothetical protein